MGIGDWGLAQSPIPNPQSPIPIYILHILTNINVYASIIYFLSLDNLQFPIF